MEATETKALAGETVRLRRVKEQDLPAYVRWSNDPDVRHWLYASERAHETLESPPGGPAWR